MNVHVLSHSKSSQLNKYGKMLEKMKQLTQARVQNQSCHDHELQILKENE